MCWSARELHSDRTQGNGLARSPGAMKVLQVITKGEVGGAQSHVLTLCRELRDRQGIEVQVAIGGDDGLQTPLACALNAAGIRVHSIPSLGNTAGVAGLAQAVRRLQAIVREQSPDLVHAHSAMAGVAARLAGARTRKPVIYTVHGFAFKAGNPWKRRVAAFAVEWLLAPLARRMVCVSEHERRLARALPLPSGRVVVVHNGIEEVPASTHLTTELAAAPPRIAMVARMAPPKRPDLLLQALARLRDDLGCEVPATFFGGGPQLASHQAMARQLGLQSVVFAGDVGDISAQLMKHSIFVLTSDHEGLPISVIEAMRGGLAIVASDLPGMHELLPDATQARLVPNDATALALALRQLVESPALRTSLGRAARQRYEQHYTAERMGMEVMATYQSALSPSPSHP